jgi:hypothetical protein
MDVCCYMYESCSRRSTASIGRQTVNGSRDPVTGDRDHACCQSATLSRVRWQGRCFPIGSDVIAGANVVSETLSFVSFAVSANFISTTIANL